MHFPLQVCGSNRCDLATFSANHTTWPGLKKGCVAGSGSSRKCGCSIGGQCFAHGGINPANPCDICDVVADPFGWSLNPVPCNDGNGCSFDDMCARRNTTHPVSGSNNVCAGAAYTCPKPVDGIDFSALLSCTKASTCDGRGGCKTEPRPKGSLCLNATDRDICMPLSYCDGARAQCPAVSRVVPIVTAGSMQLFALNASSGAYVNQSQLFPLASSGFHRLDVLPVAAVNWTSNCGPQTFAAGYYTLSSARETQCDVSRAVLSSNPAPGLSNRSTLQLVPLSMTGPRAVVDGSLVRVVFRSRNIDGTSIDRCSGEPIVLDSSPPLAGTVLHVNPESSSSAASPLASHYGNVLAFSGFGFSEEQATSTWVRLFVQKCSPSGAM